MQIVHHMGALDKRYPPNSLDAIRACLEYGAHVIEVDITALAERDYLLVHDPVLEAETTGTGAVGEALPEVAKRTYLKASEATAFHPALLSEVVRAFQDFSQAATRLQLDFKNVYPFANGDEPLHRLVSLIQPLGDRVIVSSGADWQLRRLRKLAVWLDLGLDVHYYIDWRAPDEVIDPQVPPYRAGAYGYWDDHPLATAHFYPCADYLADRCASLVGLVPCQSTFYVSHTLLAQSLSDGFNWAEALHEHGLKLDAWTLDVDNPIALDNARTLLTAGVDYITTNTPREMLAALKPA